MKYKWIFANRSRFAVRKMCEVLEISRSGFHSWLTRRPSKRAKTELMILRKIQRIFRENRKTYGSPRITDALNEELKRPIREKRVARIMKKYGISAEIPKRFKVLTTDSNHKFPISPNLLQRDFSATSPNQKWVSDVTYVSTGEGFGYLCAIKDLYDETIVGWSFESHMKT